MNLSSYLSFTLEETLWAEDPVPIQPTDYDTSWVTRLTNADGSPAHPGLLDSLLDRQREDGSWGGQIPYVHDRLLTTLSVVLLLVRFGSHKWDHDRRLAGERYIWQHVDQLQHDPHRTVGFEMILPTLLAEGRKAGLDLPYDQLQHYEDERAKKLSLLPGPQIFDTQTSALFSLEAFAEDMDTKAVTKLLLENGSIATSPSATAFLLSRFPDWRSRFPESTAYLEGLLQRYGTGLPTIAPSDIFVRAWKIYYLHHGNLSAQYAKLLKDDYQYLLDHWRPEGVGWSSVGLPESDDTAMVLLALQRAGYEVDGSSLLAYERERHFAVMDYERDPSVSANLHVLEALDTLPEKERPRVRDKILDYAFRSRQHGAYWSDKWHASVYYPTSRALMVLAPYAPEEVEKTVHWTIATQHLNGAWGQYMPTSEETALMLLALLKYHRAHRPLPHEPLRQAARYLVANEHPFEENYPEMWISKALYAPAAVIRITILAALALYCDTFGEDGLT